MNGFGTNCKNPPNTIKKEYCGAKRYGRGSVDRFFAIFCLALIFLQARNRILTPQEKHHYSRWKVLLFLTVCLLLLLITRSHHMRGPLDEHHAWRQCDTAFYAQMFYKTGINLLNPVVCWMGAHGSLILEFPLPEALMALGYHLFGSSYLIARIIVLTFFAGSAAYLFLFINLFMPRRTAAIALLVFLILPLSQFYSRAVHVDFFALFFAHGMAYHLARLRDRFSLPHFLTGTILGIIAFLIKAPYAFYLFPLIALIIFRKNNWKAIGSLLFSGLIMAASFYLWRKHVFAVNNAAPDWFFIPDYFKFTNMNDWYYGQLAQRFDPSEWRILFERLRMDLASLPGFFCLLTGASLTIGALIHKERYASLILVWLAGLLVYLLIFFKLNLIHDYYQIPFIAIASLFIAMALELPIRLLPKSWKWVGITLSIGLFCLITRASIIQTNNLIFPDSVRDEAGSMIDRLVPEDSLLLTAMTRSDCRDPRLLQRADRMGWALEINDLSPALVDSFSKEGALHLAIVTIDMAITNTLPNQSLKSYPLSIPPWILLITELSSPPSD